MRSVLSGRKDVAGVTLTLITIAIFGYAIHTAHGFRDVSRWFPLGISYAGMVLALIVMLWELGVVTAGSSESLEADATASDSESSMSATRGFLVYMAWLILLATGLMLFGAPIAVFGWLALFFRLQSKEKWVRSVLYALAATLAVVVLGAILHMFLPVGYLIPSGTWVPVVHLKF